MTDPEDRESLLEAIAMGDLAADDERVRARIEADPEFARELDDMLAVQSSLDDIGGLVRSGVPAAGSDVPGLDSARTLLHELKAMGPAGAEALRAPAPVVQARRTAPWLLVGSLAAAAIVVVLWRPWSQVGNEPERSGIVLGTSLTDLSPKGSASSVEMFTWTAAEGVLFDFEVRDPATGDVLDSQPELEQTRWAPADLRPGAWPAGWPDHFQWQVTAYDATGIFLDSAVAEVRRSRD